MTPKIRAFPASRAATVAFVFGASAVVYPLAAVLIVFPVLAYRRLAANGRRLQNDVWFWIVITGAVLFAIPPFVTSDGVVLTVGRSALVVLFAMSCIALLRPRGRGCSLGASRHVFVGVLFGLVVLIVVNSIALALIEGRFAGWSAHPNLWAARSVMGGATALALLGRRRFSMMAPLVVVTVGTAVAASASRTGLVAALIAVIVAIAIALSNRLTTTRSRRQRSVHWSLATIAAISTIAIIVSGPLANRLLSATSVNSSNQVLASEELTSRYWTRRDVRVSPVVGEQAQVAVHRISSMADDPLARLHQRAVLAPRSAATLTVELGPDAAHAGVHAFSEAGGRISVDRDGAIRALREPPSLIVAHAEPLDADWTRLTVQFLNDSESPLVVRFGIAPDMTGREHASVDVRRVGLVVGTSDVAYAPTYVADRERALASVSAARRFEYVPLAAAVAAQRPWFGHGSRSPFFELVDRAAPGALSDSDRPSHAHSTPLQVLVTDGVVGLTGLLLLGFAVARSAWRAVGAWAAPLLAAMATIAVGDATLLAADAGFSLLAVAVSAVRFGDRPDTS